LQLEEHYFITLRIDNDEALKPSPTVISLKKNSHRLEKKTMSEAYDDDYDISEEVKRRLDLLTLPAEKALVPSAKH
jgi:hypothetical protein